jgi:hypothetical protein
VMLCVSINIAFMTQYMSHVLRFAGERVRERESEKGRGTRTKTFSLSSTNTRNWCSVDWKIFPKERDTLSPLARQKRDAKPPRQKGENFFLKNPKREENCDSRCQCERFPIAKSRRDFAFKVSRLSGRQEEEGENEDIIKARCD